MKEIFNRFGFVMMWISAIFTAMMIAVIFVFLYNDAMEFLQQYSFVDFLFGLRWKPSAQEYGVLPMLIGSFVTTFLAWILAVPIGISAVLYCKYYAANLIKKLFRFTVGVLALIPSIVYGLFGLLVIAPLTSSVFGGTGFSVISTSLLLALMILPTVMTLYWSEIDAMPKEYYICALALGESKERSIVKCVVPLSSYGIFSAGVSALGRAIGETMAVLMVAGNVAKIPTSITDGIRTLTTNISLEMGYATGEHRKALIACGWLLLLLILLLELYIFRLKRKFIYAK